MTRETWASRVGVILAVAGSAVGLGNFLRFPVQCAANGGGAFMIPYFLALLFLGIPLMWAEWAMGRLGGGFGHGTAPGIFAKLWNNPLAKHLGSLSLIICFGVCVYYCYIESWTLAYAWFSVTGKYFGITTPTGMGEFLTSFQGGAPSPYFSGLKTAYVFFLITFACNIFVLWHGIRGGIEKLCNIGLPILFLFAIVLVIRVFALGAPDPTHPENSVLNGLGFIWNPDFSQLTKAKVWLAAAGQIFFTLTVGFGCIQAYASYLKKDDDIALNGLTAVSVNETAEVILGGSIAIPIAVAFFGLAGTAAIASGGAFNLGFQAVPLIFQKLPLGQLFGGLWFSLLFIAGITSSVSLLQPLISFFQDELGWSRKKGVIISAIALFICVQPVIFFLANGVLDEMDFWLGTLGIVLFALIEIIIFVWIYKPARAWDEINDSADIQVPNFFLFVLKYITPLYLCLLLIFWGRQDGLRILFLEGVPREDVPYIVASRAVMVILFIVVNYMIAVAFRRRAQRSSA